jgi:hypothetical protein
MGSFLMMESARCARHLYLGPNACFKRSIASDQTFLRDGNDIAACRKGALLLIGLELLVPRQ